MRYFGVVFEVLLLALALSLYFAYDLGSVFGNDGRCDLELAPPQWAEGVWWVSGSSYGTIQKRSYQELYTDEKK